MADGRVVVSVLHMLIRVVTRTELHASSETQKLSSRMVQQSEMLSMKAENRSSVSGTHAKGRLISQCSHPVAHTIH